MNHTFPGSGLSPPMIIFFHYTLIAAESGNLASDLPRFRIDQGSGQSCPISPSAATNGAGERLTSPVYGKLK